MEEDSLKNYILCDFNHIAFPEKAKLYSEAKRSMVARVMGMERRYHKAQSLLGQAKLFYMKL